MWRGDKNNTKSCVNEGTVVQEQERIWEANSGIKISFYTKEASNQLCLCKCTLSIGVGAVGAMWTKFYVLLYDMWNKPAYP